MAISYSLAPMPRWVVINNEGTVAGGAYLYTYSSLNKVQKKSVWMDGAGHAAWTNPIIFDLNGVQGPFYWEVDSADPEDIYYLELWTANKDIPFSGAELLWTQDDFAPAGGGGGGGDFTIYIPILNYISNNQFIDHIADQANPLTSTNIVIAPSNHKGFTPAQANPIVGTYGVLGPDIRFVKNNTAATDSISFVKFPLGTTPLTGDVTPVDYIRYQCTNSPIGESYKCFQFPICQKVQNLSNQDMSFNLWAKYGVAAGTINIYLRQYYGSGTAATPESTSTRTLLDSIALTADWTPYNINFTVPNVSGNSIGTPDLQTDDDATYIQIEMPLNAASDVLFTKPALYLGTINPTLDFQNYDQIDSVDQTPRTGDVKTSLTSLVPLGWLPMDDGTIGNTGSGADTEGAFTFQLYSTLYTCVSDTYAPVSGGRTAPGTTMANAVTDFLAGKRLTLPLSLGRALAGAGAATSITSARSLGEKTGLEEYTLVSTNLPATWSGSISTIAVTPAGAANRVPGVSGTDTTATFKVPGGSQPFSIMQPTSFVNIYIKL